MTEQSLAELEQSVLAYDPTLGPAVSKSRSKMLYQLTKMRAKIARETMRRNDRNGVLGAAAMPLGCAAASVRLLCETAEKRPIPAIRRTAAALGAEWEDLAAQIEHLIAEREAIRSKVQGMLDSVAAADPEIVEAIGQ